MGDWQTDWGRDALERIVVLLFALANLVDRAAGAPFLRRRRVLEILNCGEVEAHAFLIGMVCGESVPADALEQTGDAAHLAVRLRALALMLCLMLARRAALPGVRVTRAGRRMSAEPIGRHIARPPPPVSDTS